MSQARSVRRLAPTVRAQQGFTMLEVLVALLILLIGLLGLAGLLVTTQQGEMEAYQRKQVIVLLQDMMDRVTANPIVARCYAITTYPDAGRTAYGTGSAVDSTYNCSGGTPNQNTRGSEDMKAWNNALLGTSEEKSGASVGGVLEARGCVTNPATGVYAVSVAWRGLAPAPIAAAVTRNTCGLNQYKDATNTVDERLRRVMSVTIRIADLSAP